MTLDTNSQGFPFHELKIGDRVAVAHMVRVGSKVRTTRTAGTVLRTERRRLGLAARRGSDDTVAGEVILLELPDGELAALPLDTCTRIDRA